MASEDSLNYIKKLSMSIKSYSTGTQESDSSTLLQKRHF